MASLGPNELGRSSHEQNGQQHFADYIFKLIFLEENVFILIQFPLKFVFQGLMDIKSLLVQVMAWCQTGTKPLPEPVLTQI